MSYYPKNYQDKIDAYQEILSQSEDLSKIDIPNTTDENFDSASLQKQINNISKDILSNIDNLISDIWNDIQTDLLQACTNYIKDVNNDITDQPFPFEDWASCAYFRYSRKKWNIQTSWFDNATDFDKESSKSIALYLDNLNSYLKTVLSIKNNDFPSHYFALKKEILKLPEKYHMYIEHLLFSENPSLFTNEIINNIDNISNIKIENTWSIYASFELCKNLGSLEGTKLMDKFEKNIKNQPQKDIKLQNLIDKVLFNHHWDIGFVKNKSGYIYPEWEKIKELMIEDKKRDIGLTELILNKIEKMISAEKYKIDYVNEMTLNYTNLIGFVRAYELDKKLAIKSNENKIKQKI